jgi:hypothetical protein
MSESELQTPPLRLTIEGRRWDGESWVHTGEKAVVQHLDSEDVRAAIWATLARRLRLRMLGLVAEYEALDWDAPNAPTYEDVGRLVESGEAVIEMLRGLQQLAPEVMNDDEGEDDDA